MSKVAILTQPLGPNYGGILQAFALQHVLREMGHQPITIDRRAHLSPFFQAGSFMKGGLLWAMGRQSHIRRQPNAKERAMIYRHTHRFIHEHIVMSETIYSTETLRQYAVKEQFDAYMVGSDQVWRKAYSPCMPNFFLDFLPEESRAKRMAYAASFGVDKWQFSPRETKQYAALAKRFDAISVREDSAVGLCREHLGVKATHVLDPTMLVDRSVYEGLAMSRYAHPSKGDLFCYILDRTPEKMKQVKQIAEKKGLTPFELLPEPFCNRNETRPEECVMPPVEQWLRSFMDAKYVITDSFHGTVFSLILGLNCTVAPNPRRGLSRFESLISMLDIQHDIKDGLVSLQGWGCDAKVDPIKNSSVRYLDAILK